MHLQLLQRMPYFGVALLLAQQCVALKIDFRPLPRQQRTAQDFLSYARLQVRMKMAFGIRREREIQHFVYLTGLDDLRFATKVGRAASVLPAATSEDRTRAPAYRCKGSQAAYFTEHSNVTASAPAQALGQTSGNHIPEVTLCW